jgi:hypothetical protein
MNLKPHEVQALEFMELVGSDCIGVIDSEEKLAAAFVFATLANRNLMSVVMTNDGPLYSMTNAGMRALAKSRMH